MKQSEARILIYLSQVPNPNKNVSTISSKLQIGYNYLGNLLRDMVNKKWLMKHKLANKMFYDLTQQGHVLLKLAKEVNKDGN